VHAGREEQAEEISEMKKTARAGIASQRGARTALSLSWAFCSNDVGVHGEISSITLFAKEMILGKFEDCQGHLHA
jgi:hypothetical protein